MVVWEATGIIMLVLAFVSIIIPAILSDSEGHLECGWILSMKKLYGTHRSQKRGH